MTDTVGEYDACTRPSTRNEQIRSALLIATTLFLFVLPMPESTTLRQILFFPAASLLIFLVPRDSTRLPLKRVYVFWLIVALLSVPMAVDARYSLGEIKAEIGYGFLTYYVFFRIARSPKELIWWARGLVLSLIVMSVLAITLWATGRGTTNPAYIYNGVGPHLTFLVTVFPFVVAALVSPSIKGFPRFLPWVVLPLALYAALVTANRVIWIALGISTATLAVLILNKTQNRAIRVRVIVVVAILVVSGALGFYFALAERLGVSVGTSNIVENTVTKDPRPRLWHFAVSEIASHPVSGIGFGVRSFDIAFPQWQQQNGTLFHAHNIFLDAGLQMGILGIVALAVVFLSIVFEYWRFYRNSNPVVQIIGACGIAMVLGVVAKNMTDHFFERDLALLFWAIVGMTLGYGHRIGAARVRPTNEHDS